MALSENKKMLLYNGVKNNGVVRIDDAKNLYSSDSAGVSAVKSLQFQGFLKYRTPGVFEIVKLPRSVKEKIELEKEKGDE